MAQQFNDTSLNEGKVPRTGTTNEGSAPAAPSASNSNPANVKAEGTDNPKADTRTISAGNPSTPAGKSQIPSGVQNFDDDGV